MGMVSAPVGNGIIQQKDIFRLAAAIYSENSDVVSETETQLQMVKTRYCQELCAKLFAGSG